MRVHIKGKSHSIHRPARTRDFECVLIRMETFGTYLVETSASALAPSAAPATTGPPSASAVGDCHADGSGALTFCMCVCTNRKFGWHAVTPPTSLGYVLGDFCLEIMPFQFHPLVRATCGCGGAGCSRSLTVVNNGIGDAAQPAQRCGHFHRNCRSSGGAELD